MKLAYRSLAPGLMASTHRRRDARCLREIAAAGDVVRTASWPYWPAQCPGCRYLQAFDPPIEDDDGYEVLGFCRHPRIGMELFQLQRHAHEDEPGCPCFFPRRVVGHRP
jgi:hypothetical protein